MKKLIVLALSLLLGVFTTYSQSNIITALVTVTNSAGTSSSVTNSLTVNGSTRYFTNFIQSYQNNILQTNNIYGAASNIFISYISFPQNGVNVTKPATNQVQFQSWAGNPLIVSVGIYSTNWGTLTLTTNTITNSIAVRVPMSSVGIIDRTNIGNGMAIYLGDNSITNPLPANCPLVANLATLLQIQAQGLASTNFSYLIGNNSTNFARLIGLAGTNFSQQVSNYFLGLFNTYNIASITPSPDGPAFKPGDFFQPSNNVLTQFAADFPLGLPASLSYFLSVPVVGGSGNDIGLIQTNINNNANSGPNYDPNGGDSITRLSAFYNSDFKAMFENGKTFFDADTSHNIQIQDNNGTIRYEQYDIGSGSPVGGNIFRAAGGQDAIKESLNGFVNLQQTLTSDTAGWSEVMEGTVTNFITYTNSLSASSIPVDYVTWPAWSTVTNGDSIYRKIGIEFASSTSTKRLQISFNGSTILDTGAIANTGGSAGGIDADCTLTVQDASTPSSAIVTYTCRASWTGTASATITSVAHTTVDLTSSGIDYHISLITGAGGADDDERVAMDNVEFKPSSRRSIGQ